jgi:low affinity Fe/Cu permease
VFQELPLEGWYNKQYMKYASIFATIVIIWIAVILMAFTRPSASEVFQLYVAAIISTLILFLIGFTRK